MKAFKAVLTSILLYVLFFATGSQFSACRKTNNVYDTVTVHDTIYDVKDGLVALYTFTGGSLKDSSGYGNDIIFSNAVKTTDRFGNANNAYLFDGSTSYMQVKNSASLNPSFITMVAMVKLNAFYMGNYHASQILGKGFQDQLQGVYGMRIAPTGGDCCTFPDTSKENLNAFYGDYGTTVSAHDSIYFFRTTRWATVAVTYDGAQMKTYVDGQLKSTWAGSATFTKNTSDVFIGRAENPTYPYWLNGVIDEIRIYNRVLSAGAVMQLSKLKQ